MKCVYFVHLIYCLYNCLNHSRGHAQLNSCEHKSLLYLMGFVPLFKLKSLDDFLISHRKKYKVTFKMQ